jgi:hypothetical protein
MLILVRRRHFGPHVHYFTLLPLDLSTALESCVEIILVDPVYVK